jgi:hypothetical protein
MYSALMGWMVSLTTTFRTSAEAGEEMARRARASRDSGRDIPAIIFLYPTRKIFVFFELAGAGRAAGRQNLESKGLAGKILRNKELAG